MIITISRDCGSARRAYRIECPDDARFHTDHAALHETILIPGPDHHEHPERSVWLRLDDALGAAREGRYGLRLLAEEESPRANLAEVGCARNLRLDPESHPMVRR